MAGEEEEEEEDDDDDDENFRTDELIGLSASLLQ